MSNFEDTYLKNGCRFVVYKWMSLMDENSCGVEELDFLLCNEYQLYFRKDHCIDHKEALEEWLNKAKELVVTSAHKITFNHMEELNGKEAIVSFTVDYQGINKENQILKAKTMHTWHMHTEGKGMPRIKRIDVDMLEEFHPIEGEFEPMSLINKVNSLVYRWFSLLDRSYYDKRVDDFVSLLDHTFVMKYPMATWTNPNEVRQWLLKSGKESRSAHHIKDITVKTTGKQRAEVAIELTWHKLVEDRCQESVFKYDWEIVDYNGFLPKVGFFEGKPVEE